MKCLKRTIFLSLAILLSVPAAVTADTTITFVPLHKTNNFVIPAKAGIKLFQGLLDAAPVFTGVTRRYDE